MKKLGQFLTNEDTFTLEPFDSWDKNFLFWLKKWIINKLDTLSSRLVDDIDLFKSNPAIR